jgi:hypothetical protein
LSGEFAVKYPHDVRFLNRKRQTANFIVPENAVALKPGADRGVFHLTRGGGVQGLTGGRPLRVCWAVRPKYRRKTREK